MIGALRANFGRDLSSRGTNGKKQNSLSKCLSSEKTFFLGGWGVRLGGGCVREVESVLRSVLMIY